MLHALRRVGPLLVLAGSLTFANVAGAAAQGAYPGNYMAGSGGMSYRQPAPMTRYPAAGGTYGMGAGASMGQPSYGAKSLYGAFARYTVRSGDTFARIAARFGVTQAALRGANPRVLNPNRIFTGQILFIPVRSSVIYAVHFGDTLSRIAARFGTTISAIAQANPIIMDVNLIFPGEKLVIPAVTGGGMAPYTAPSGSAGTYTAPSTPSGGYSAPSAPSGSYRAPSAGSGY